MKARNLVERSVFDPQALQIAFKAFDDAWEEIAPHFGYDDIPNARLRLAHAILIASHNGADADRLRDKALQGMALGYRAPLSASADVLTRALEPVHRDAAEPAPNQLSRSGARSWPGLFRS